ncbi:MAG: methyltransferase domain-containing protein [bacterium]
MRKRIIGYLRCPLCKDYVKLVAFSGDDEEVEDGVLICECGQWYPVIANVPRMLLGDLRGDYSEFLGRYGKELSQIGVQWDSYNSGSFEDSESKKQVKESFGSKWKSQPKWGVSGKSREIAWRWFLERYGWESEEDLRRYISSRRMILDAGTGLGRVIKDFCELGAIDGGFEIFGVELSDCADEAYQNVGGFRNVHIIQGDITRLPFEKGSFDFILSDGVLHHTPDTRVSFLTLSRYLQKNGEIAIYVYRKKGPIREFCDDYIRKFSTSLSADDCWRFSESITKLGRSLSDLKVEFEVPEDIPILGIRAGRYNLQRFIYWNILKCYWNDELSFDENNLVNFDWYHPRDAHRHTVDEVESWFDEAGLKIKHLKEIPSGISVIGEKVGI